MTSVQYWMYEDADLQAWLSPLSGGSVETVVRRVALATLARELFGRWPKVTEEGKLLELLKARVPPGTPKHCITPNGRRDGHGMYVEFSADKKLICTFCKEPLK